MSFACKVVDLQGFVAGFSVLLALLLRRVIVYLWLCWLFMFPGMNCTASFVRASVALQASFWIKVALCNWVCLYFINIEDLW